MEESEETKYKNMIRMIRKNDFDLQKEKEIRKSLDSMTRSCAPEYILMWTIQVAIEEFEQKIIADTVCNNKCSPPSQHEK